MKRTLIENIPEAVPSALVPLISGAPVYDSSCSREARVYFIDADRGYYLKSAKKGTLSAEAEMTAYFYRQGLGAEVLYYSSWERDWLCTAKVQGEDCIDRKYLDDPDRLSALLGERLRMLHELRVKDCPVQNRMKGYLALAEENYQTDNYSKEHFPDSFGFRSGEEAYAVLQEGKALLKHDVLIHGDYCLPNIMLDHWRFSGFIDLGNAGMGDRHVDLFWGAWSLGFNLHTDKYRDRFFDAYGRDNIDPDALRTVAAAEVFG